MAEYWGSDKVPASYNNVCGRDDCHGTYAGKENTLVAGMGEPKVQATPAVAMTPEGGKMFG